MRDAVYPLLLPALKILLPALAGAAGVLLFVLSPESHAAFCVVRP